MRIGVVFADLGFSTNSIATETTKSLGNGSNLTALTLAYELGHDLEHGTLELN